MIPLFADASPLSRLHALEWRYDGPLPAAELESLGSNVTRASRAAAGDGLLLDRMARGAVAAQASARRRRPAEPVAAPAGAGSRLAALRAAALAHRT